MKRITKTLFLILISSSYLFAQNVGINSTGATPNASAILDLDNGNPWAGSNGKGMLVPRLTNTEMNNIVSPATGLYIYNTTCNVFDYWNGSAWIPFPSSTLATPGPITGSVSVCQGSSGITYSVPIVTGASTYTWTVPSGATITSGQNTNSITVTFGVNSGNVCVTAGNSCGTSAAYCTTVNALAGPTVTANAAPASICGGGSSTLTANGASSYTWLPSSSLNVSTGSTVSASPTVTTTYTVTGTSGTCTATQTVTVTVSSNSNLWTQLTPAGGTPAALYNNQSAVWDPVHNKMYMFGGWNGSSLTNQMWQFDPNTGAPNGTWTLESPTGTTPPAVQGAASVWDPGNQVMYIFGESNLSKYSPGLNQYTPLSPTGGPSTRNGAGAVWNPVANVMYIFGGNNSGTLFNDLWQYDPNTGVNGTWTELLTTGPMSARYDMIYPIWNPINNTMWVFGGGISGSEVNDIWQYTPAAPGTNTWVEINATGGPSGRDGQAVVLDPSTNIVYWFSGRCCNYSTEVDDFWEFNLSTSTWTQITPCGGTGTLPPARVAMAAVWNAATNVFYIYGGAGTSGNLNDTWQYTP